MPNFLITGLGASAGGIQALREFFEHTPPDSGIAYVVILHLSPDHDSQLARVLQHATKMPVLQVTEKTLIQPNHIYVIPPDKHLAIDEESLIVSPNTVIEERRAPIDIFFRSLAETCREQAVGVVLSGTGANGSMGLKRIKEQGGAVFVQNPREAEFSEMPRNAISTDLVDDVMNVAQIPARIIAYRNLLNSLNISDEAEDQADIEQRALREIFTQLRTRTGHDFSNYKRATLMRRIERRISVRALPGLPAYAQYITEHLDETHALLKDLLISVTNFFRDKKPFEELETSIIPKIFEGKGAGEPVRIWAAGCATGEEAYSIAMLCAERAFDVLDAPKIQIFATDIDEAAIATAREGLYSINDAADVSPERLSRFFIKENDGYRVRRELRETILFANHNFLKDPPFSRLDMVTCRNVLIYLNRPAQERVMETFHFALKPGGYLMLGTSESADMASDLFRTESRDLHIFQTRLAVPIRTLPALDLSPQIKQEAALPAPQKTERKAQGAERLEYADIHLQLIEQYAPPSLIVNANFDVVHLSERAGRYLQMVAGEPTQAILKIIHEELRSELRNGLYQALQKNIPVNSSGIKVKTIEGIEYIGIHVRPITAVGDESRKFLLVVFEPVGEDGELMVAHTTDEPATLHLEEEVRRLRLQLRTSGEQHEFQAEELKAGNEELQAMNEELRSATEELETSKEELQSVNEELSTVNQELKVKVEETSMISSNLQNLINSTDIGTIFLDRSFRLVLFTPATRSIFNLIQSDYGRPITDITHKLRDNRILDEAHTVLEKLHTLEREADTTDGRSFLVRLSPYRTKEDRIQGVVLAFVDITERKKAEIAVRASEERQALMLRLSDALRPLATVEAIKLKASQVLGAELHADRVFYAELDKDSNDMVVVNSGFHSSTLPSVNGRYALGDFGLHTAKTLRAGHPVVYADVAGLDALSTAEKAAYKQLGIAAQVKTPLVKGGQLVAFLAVHQSKPRIWSQQEIQTIEETAERTWAILERARAEEALTRSELKYRTLFDSIDEGFNTIEVIFDEQKKPVDFKVLEINPAYKKITGFGDDVVGKRLRELMPGIHESVIERYGEVALTGEPIRFEQFVPELGAWLDMYVSRVGGDGSSTVAIVFNDMTSRKRAEEQQAFLLKLSDALRPLRGAKAIQEIAMTLLGPQMGVNRAYYIEVLPDVDTLVTRTGYFKNVPPLAGHTKLSAFGPAVHEMYMAGKTVVLNDVLQELELTEAQQAAFESIQFRAGIGVPLLKEGQLLAIVTVHQAVPRKWTKEELALLEEVAERTWDAVERAQMEMALRESEETRSLAITAAQMGTFEWNSLDNKVALSEISRKVFGIGPDNDYPTIDEGFSLVHPEDRADHALVFEHASRNGYDYHTTYRIIRAVDGKMAWVEERGKGYRDPVTNATRILGVHWDVTERVLAEQQVKDLLKQKEDFIGIASHELKTPVTSIKTYGQIVEENLGIKGDKENEVLVNKMNGQVDRLANLITDLLDTTRIEEGKLIYHKQSFALNELLTERVEEIKLSASHREVKLQLDGAPNVFADRERIGQVVTNLLSNAVKYSPDNTEIIVTSEVSNKEVTVSVTDAGIGIPQESVNHIFDRFYRVGGQAMITYPGMGLGLYISAEIIKNHGRHISVTSQEGGGSVFQFSLTVES